MLPMLYQEFAKWVKGNGEQCTAMAKKTGMRCPHKAKHTIVLGIPHRRKKLTLFLCQGHLANMMARKSKEENARRTKSTAEEC